LIHFYKRAQDSTEFLKKKARWGPMELAKKHFSCYGRCPG